MTLRALACAGLVAAVLAGTAGAAGQPEDLAQTAAESWLKLTDAGNAAASWDRAATLFKRAVTKERWTQTLAGVRPPLGQVVSRRLISRQPSEKLAGAPDGKYMIIRYETAFAKNASAIESLTAMVDPDGVWRVSGYYIR